MLRMQTFAPSKTAAKCRKHLRSPMRALSPHRALMSAAHHSVGACLRAGAATDPASAHWQPDHCTGAAGLGSASPHTLHTACTMSENRSASAGGHARLWAQPWRWRRQSWPFQKPRQGMLIWRRFSACSQQRWHQKISGILCTPASLQCLW